MAELTFIGLANYKPSTNNLVNIIFKSNKGEKTTYQYNFSSSLALPITWNNIPTLIDVTIPAGREISAQLDTNIIVTDVITYYLYIRAYNSINGVIITSVNIIWQQSKTLIRGLIREISSISIYLSTLTKNYETVAGGSIHNSTGEIKSTNPIKSNIIYTSVAATINIQNPNTYDDIIPLFIMSDATITLHGNLITTSTGSINIVGTGAGMNSCGILIDANITITGNVTLNGRTTGDTGTGYGYGYGILFVAPATITVTSNVTLNGIANGNGKLCGIGLNMYHFDSSFSLSGNVILNGMVVATGPRTDWTQFNDFSVVGTGVEILDSDYTFQPSLFIISGNVILNGSSSPYGNGIFISANIVNNGSGILTLNGRPGLNTGSGIVVSGASFIITINNNSTFPYIKRTGGTILGKFNISIDSSSNVIYSTYNLLENIPEDNINSIVNNINWRLINSLSAPTNWQLLTDIVSTTTQLSPTTTMPELTFIGLANYRSNNTNLVNIIFKSNSGDKTTYQYYLSNKSRVLELTNHTWKDIPNLTNVIIPAGREISAQLNTDLNDNSMYYLYIRSSINPLYIIWQISKTTIIEGTVSVETINNYLSSIEYSTLGSGNIINNTSTSFLNVLKSNIIYNSREGTTTINITNMTYNNNWPIFIMSNDDIILGGKLITTSTGSINIVGTGININEPSITGNVTLTGTNNSPQQSSYGINIKKITINRGNVTLNGTAMYGWGIQIRGGSPQFGIPQYAYISNNLGNVILNGMGLIGIQLKGSHEDGRETESTDRTISISGNVTLNGTAMYGNGIIIGTQPVYQIITVTGNVILNGMATTGSGIFIYSKIIIEGNLELNGTAVNGNGIKISSEIGGTDTSIVTLNGKSTNGNGVDITNYGNIGNVFFIITITNSQTNSQINSQLPNIKNSGGTISGTINISIDPSSNLSIPGIYNLLENIPEGNIYTKSGFVNNMNWELIHRPPDSNNWHLETSIKTITSGIQPVATSTQMRWISDRIQPVATSTQIQRVGIKDGVMMLSSDRIQSPVATNMQWISATIPDWIKKNYTWKIVLIVILVLFVLGIILTKVLKMR